MSLKVIGAGFGRTGTFSVCTALNQLGYPCYHMFEVIDNKENKSHLDFWCNVANGKAGSQYNWDQVFFKYSATVDSPACCVWRELVLAYPDAKVVLTVHPRGADAWYESTIDTIYASETMWQFKVLELVTPFGRKFGYMSRKLIWQRLLKGTMNGRSKAIERYDEHIAEVIAEVPAEKLLVFSADQGWKPLCEFLGVPEPSTDFPNVNDRAAIKQAINGTARGAYLILGVSAFAISSFIYVLVYAFS